MTTTLTPAVAGSALELFDRGFHDLISITPPGAPLAAGSKLTASSLGKAPGRKLPNGTWAGYNWRAHATTKEDVAQWVRDGANIGLRSDRYPGLDIDALDAEVAQSVEAIALETLGPAPIRTGRAPKRLLMYRLADDARPISRMRLHLEKNGASHLIELLGTGQQYLVAGIHPGTEQPYAWDNGGPPAAADLTPITREQVERFFERVRALYERHDWVAYREGDGFDRERAKVDQDELRAPSLKHLAELVAKIPNDDAHYPGRDDYVRVGYAIRAAAGDQIEEGLEVFAAWASRHVKDDRVAGNPATPRDDYDRMHPPFSIGWEWLKDQARAVGHSDAAETFEPVTDVPPADPVPVAPARKVRVRSLSDVKSRPVDWLMVGWCARGHATSFVGWPGEGKTTSLVDLVAAMSNGHTLPNGTMLPRPLRVLYLADEETESIVKLRLLAAGANMDNIVVISREDYHALTLPSHAAFWEDVIRTARVDVVVVDPMKAFLDDGLSDISEVDARKFMKAFGLVLEHTHTGALVIRHPNKATAAGHTIGVTAGSGSGAYTQVARIEFFVGRASADDDTLKAIVPIKNNLGPLAPALLFRVTSVIVETDEPNDRGETAESVARVSWQGSDPRLTVDDVMAHYGRRKHADLDDAKAFLKEFLADGPQSASAVVMAGLERGISKRTLERAREFVAWSAKHKKEQVWGLPKHVLADYKRATAAE